MSDRASFPDVEAALAAALSDLATTGSVTPPNLQTQLPYVRIARFGGADDGWTDAALVSIDAFAADRADALQLAETIRQRMIAPGPIYGNGVMLDAGTTATAPNEVPWSNDQTIRRFTASYRVTARRPS